MFQRFVYSCVLVVAILFSNLGMALNIHYCGDEIEKVVIGYASSINCTGDSHEDSCCDEKEMIGDEACCKNETIKQKTTESVVKVLQIQLTSDFISPVVYKFTPIVISEVTLPKKINVAFHCDSNAPPLYKLYNQYLLYA